MKSVIALVLATALFLGVGALMSPPVVAEVKVTILDDGFLIENGNIPMFSELIKTAKPEEALPDVLAKLEDVLYEYKYPEYEWDENLSATFSINIRNIDYDAYLLMDTDYLGEDQKIELAKLDSSIGILDDKNNGCFIIYSFVDLATMKGHFVSMRQTKDTTEIHANRDIGKDSKSLILRKWMDKDHEKIKMFEFDILWSNEYYTNKMRDTWAAKY